MKIISESMIRNHPSPKKVIAENIALLIGLIIGSNNLISAPFSINANGLKNIRIINPISNQFLCSNF